MRRIISTAIVFALCFSLSQSKAQDEPSIPNEISVLIGGLAGLTLYSSHVALGKIYRDENSNPDQLNISYRDAGGIRGGTEVSIQQFEDALPMLNGSDQEYVEKLIEGQHLILKQCDSMRELLKVWADGESDGIARARFKAARTESGAMIMELLGLPEELVE